MEPAIWCGTKHRGLDIFGRAWCGQNCSRYRRVSRENHLYKALTFYPFLFSTLAAFPSFPSLPLHLRLSAPSQRSHRPQSHVRHRGRRRLQSNEQVLPRQHGRSGRPDSRLLRARAFSHEPAHRPGSGRSVPRPRPCRIELRYFRLRAKGLPHCRACFFARLHGRHSRRPDTAQPARPGDDPNSQKLVGRQAKKGKGRRCCALDASRTARRGRAQERGGGRGRGRKSATQPYVLHLLHSKEWLPVKVGCRGCRLKPAQGLPASVVVAQQCHAVLVSVVPRFCENIYFD